MCSDQEDDMGTRRVLTAGRSAFKAVLASALALRAAVLISAGRPWDAGTWSAWTIDPDSHGYLALASDLSDGVQDSASTRTPGYPVFLAATGAASGSTLPAVILQQLVDVATAAIAGLMAGRSGGNRWWTASLAYLLMPAPAVYSSRILPDCILALVCAVTCLVWLSAGGRSGMRVLVAACGMIGLLLSAGTLVKPALMFASVVYAILVLANREVALRGRALAVAVLLATSSAGPLALRFHNRVSFGLDAISAQDGYEQAGRVWVLTGRATQLEFLTEVKDSVDLMATVDGTVDFGLRNRIYREMALSEFSEHPAEVLVPHVTSWPRFFSTGIGGTLRYMGLPPNSPLSLPLKAAGALLYLSMPVGLILGALSKRIRSSIGPLLALAGAWMAVMALVHGPLAGPRYGLTFFPVLCAAATASLWLLFRRKEIAAGTNGTSAQ